MFDWLSAIDVLVDFLFPAERVALKWSCRRIHQQLTWNVVERGFHEIVFKELLKYTSNAYIVLNMLKDHNHVLCGSFLLRCISGNENIIPNDIDLYFMAKTQNNASFLTKQEQDEVKVHDFSHLLLQVGTLMKGHGEGYTDLPIRSVHYILSDFYKNEIIDNQIQNMTMNLLQIPYEFDYIYAKDFLDKYKSFFPEMQNEDKYTLRFTNIQDYISKTCDMQFLSNMYDGCKLRVRHWNSIIEKITVIESFRGIYTRNNGYSGCAKFFLHRIYKRMQKYQERGYRFIWKDVFHEDYLMKHVSKCDGKYFQIYDDGATCKIDSDVEV